jgi:hypothetical protein
MLKLMKWMYGENDYEIQSDVVVDYVGDFVGP